MSNTSGSKTPPTHATSCSCSGCLWPRSLSSGEHPPAPSTPAALTRARSALALYRCQAFVPPASGISRVAVRNAASIDMGAKKKPKKKPVKKQVRLALPWHPPPSTAETVPRLASTHRSSPIRCTRSLCAATPGAKRRGLTLRPRGHQGLRRRPQRLRLPDRACELEASAVERLTCHKRVSASSSARSARPVRCTWCVLVLV